MILESIVTSVDQEGRVNIAPMGPRVDGDLSLDDPRQLSFVLRPFDSSRTYHNLIETRKAVIHVTDDAELFAKAAVDAISPQQSAELVQRLGDSDWWPLRDLSPLVCRRRRGCFGRSSSHRHALPSHRVTIGATLLRFQSSSARRD